MASAQDTPLVQALSIPAIAFGVYCLIFSPGRMLAALVSAPAPLMLAMACIVSALWSIDPSGTLRRAVLLTGLTLFSYAVCAKLGFQEILRMVCWTFIAIALVGVLALIVSPSTAIHQDQHYPAIRGFFAQKNIAGRTMLVGVVSALAASWLWRRDLRKLPLSLVALALCILATLVSLSATAIFDLMLVLSVFVGLLVWRSMGRGLASLLAAACLVLVPVLSYFAYEAWFSGLLDTAGRDVTFTGRTFIWSELWSSVSSRAPFMGFGYEAFWTSDSDGASVARWEGLGAYLPAQAHNGLMQLLTALGLVGAITGLVIVLRFGFRAFSTVLSRSDDRVVLGLASAMFFIYYCVVNFTENEFLTYSGFIWGFFVMCYVKLFGTKSN